MIELAKDILHEIFFGKFTPVLAGCLILWVGYRLASVRTTRDRKLNFFNTTAEAFSNTLIPSINKLDRGQYKFDVIKADFPAHREAMLRFVQHLRGKALRQFKNDWNEYEQWYQDICCCDVSKHIYADDAFNKKKSINPSTFLNKLLIHATPK